MSLEQRIAACSEQTQADIRTLARVYRTLGIRLAQNRFQHMLKERNWTLAEAAIVADLAKELGKSEKSVTDSSAITA